MAVTGIAIIVFVVAHMVGNWKIFLPDVDGVPDIDIYAEALRELLVPFFPPHVVLWLLRTGLIVAFIFHLHAAYSLTLMNRRARPDDYAGPRHYIAASYASRTMRWSGVLFAAFLVFHLADLTWGIEPAATGEFTRGQVFDNFVATFSRPAVTVFYVAAMVALGIHLYHGAWSMFQSLGVNNPKFNQWRRYLAWGLAGVVVVGNSIMPVAVLFGWVGGGS